MKTVLVPLCAFLNTHRATSREIAFIDSTPIKICDSRRIKRHRVFENIAKRGKSSMGWFYGFKLHIIVNDCGELIAFFVIQGNVDDRQKVPKPAKGLIGKLFGDKGYIAKWLTSLLESALTYYQCAKKI